MIVKSNPNIKMICGCVSETYWQSLNTLKNSCHGDVVVTSQMIHNASSWRLGARALISKLHKSSIRLEIKPRDKRHPREHWYQLQYFRSLAFESDFVARDVNMVFGGRRPEKENRRRMNRKRINFHKAKLRKLLTYNGLMFWYGCKLCILRFEWYLRFKPSVITIICSNIKYQIPITGTFK